MSTRCRQCGAHGAHGALRHRLAQAPPFRDGLRAGQLHPLRDLHQCGYTELFAEQPERLFRDLRPRGRDLSEPFRAPRAAGARRACRRRPSAGGTPRSSGAPPSPRSPDAPRVLERRRPHAASIPTTTPSAVPPRPSTPIRKVSIAAPPTSSTTPVKSAQRRQSRGVASRRRGPLRARPGAAAPTGSAALRSHTRKNGNEIAPVMPVDAEGGRAPAAVRPSSDPAWMAMDSPQQQAPPRRSGSTTRGAPGWHSSTASRPSRPRGHYRSRDARARRGW